MALFKVYEQASDLPAPGTSQRNFSGRGLPTEDFSFPLDAIRSVWQDARGIWCIALKGMFGEHMSYWLYT